MQLEGIHVYYLFLSCLHEFDPKKVHMMLTLMFYFKFKDISIVNNYVGKEVDTIVRTRYYNY
jgi:hypothetical protein